MTELYFLNLMVQGYDDYTFQIYSQIKLASMEMFMAWNMLV